MITERLVLDGYCHDWDLDHEWVREHRDPLIGRTADADPQNPYLIWEKIRAALRRQQEDWD